MKTHWIYMIATAVTLSSACVGDEVVENAPLDIDGAADTWGPSSSVTFIDEEPRPGETLTQARTRSLTTYAEALLAAWDQSLMESFARREVVGEPLSSAYTIRVEGGSCFNEEERWGSDFDIVSDDDVSTMIRQVSYAIEFLARFHEDANGYPNRFFDTLSLCPTGQVDGDLVLQGRVLYIGVDYSFGSIKTKDAFEIRESWASGDHLASYYPDLEHVWWLLDPIGTPRLVLRDAIADAASYVSGRLAEMLEQPDETNARADLLDIVGANVIPDYEEGEGVSFSANAVAEIEGLDLTGLRELASLWRGFLDDPENWEGMADAVAATHQATATNSYDIDLDQWGLIVVGNFHNITVDISVFLPRNREFVRYVTIEPVEQNVTVRQRGLVCVYTIDNVEVNLSVTADRGVETAGLERALDRLTTN